MSVEFSNAYQEILLENAVSIIKQNFLLQTNLKLSENLANEKNEVIERYNSLKNDFEQLKESNRNFEQYKAKAEQNTNAHEEKNRLQIAVNEEMRKTSLMLKQISSKEETIKAKDDEIKKLNEYIALLEDNIAINKLKKLNPSKVISEEKIAKKIESPSVEEPVVKDIEQKVDGSTF